MAELQTLNADASAPSFIDGIDTLDNILNEIDGLAAALVASGQAHDLPLLNPEKILTQIGARIEEDVAALRGVKDRLHAAYLAGRQS